MKRQQIGFLFIATYEKWAGGAIYIINLVKALNLLPDDRKPELAIFHGFNSPIDDIKSIGYPFIRFYEVHSDSLFKKAWYKIKRIITGRSAFYTLLPEFVYPYNPYIFLGKKPINWIPDFQEWHLPQMFSKTEIEERKQAQRKIASSGGVVVFSSNDAQKDFQKFFPDHNCELRLLRFASMLPEYRHLNIKTITSKYEIQGNYFMSPNQFWKHKNHKVIFEAISYLREENLDFQIVFTGSTDDYRNREYFTTLQQYIEEHELQRWIKFLGFIDRAEQLSLMYHSRAIIQPSLFEGWSTVVEDTKAMNQYIILSDIPVHREQINYNCAFFNPHSAPELAQLIKSYLGSRPPRQVLDYQENINEFSNSILKVISHA